MEYLSPAQLAREWDLTAKYIRSLCREGKIPGAVRSDTGWHIPMDAPKPEDHRVKSGKYVGWREKYQIRKWDLESF